MKNIYVVTANWDTSESKLLLGFQHEGEAYEFKSEVETFAESGGQELMGHVIADAYFRVIAVTVWK